MNMLGSFCVAVLIFVIFLALVLALAVFPFIVVPLFIFGVVWYTVHQGLS